MEALVIRIFEVVSKMVNGVYDQNNHELWYDKTRVVIMGLSFATKFKVHRAIFMRMKLLEQTCNSIETVRRRR